MQNPESAARLRAAQVGRNRPLILPVEGDLLNQIALRNNARAKLVGSRDRLDAHRLRRTRNWMTPLESDQANPHWSTLVSREEVLQKAACALEQGLVNCTGKRAERRAAREAILGTLQHFNLIQRTRGGLPWTAQSAERFL